MGFTFRSGCSYEPKSLHVKPNPPYEWISPFTGILLSYLLFYFWTEPFERVLFSAIMSNWSIL
ncbi:hypothetical protein HMPREF9374_0248 [Desmospora sp. 8437]|nr:hypothetical protein HMPREF9374_0248 [Desmospora sp. 8437]